MVRFKVLLIDDEPLALEGMQIWIDWEELGFEVCGVCGNGLEGLRMMEKLEPDLVMVDIHMPGLSGLDMIGEWQKLHSRSPKFVILTGYSDFEYARKAMRYGVNRYLLKPLDEEIAAADIRLIYRELMTEWTERHMSAIARHEETLRLIKEVLFRQQVGEEGAEHLRSLSAGTESWKVCRIQARREQIPVIGEIAADILGGESRLYVVPVLLDQIAICFGSPLTGEKGSAEARIETLARRLAGFRVFMAIGSEETSLLTISRSYETAGEALLHAFYESGETGILRFGATGDKEYVYSYNQLELAKRMLDALHLVDHTLYSDCVDTLDEAFRSAPLHPGVARKIVFYLLHEIRTYMSGQQSGEQEGSASLFEIPEIGDVLLTFYDLTEMLRSCGRVCFGLLLKQNPGEVQGIVNDINGYIRTHYRETLTIKSLAERFFLHPTYLGQLLIRKNGIGFNEFIHNLRIEEAGQLLRENRYKNSEVAERVGYLSYTQFLKQFEKRMGMSPNEFKKT